MNNFKGFEIVINYYNILENNFKNFRQKNSIFYLIEKIIKNILWNISCWNCWMLLGIKLLINLLYIKALGTFAYLLNKNKAKKYIKLFYILSLEKSDFENNIGTIYSDEVNIELNISFEGGK